MDTWKEAASLIVVVENNSPSSSSSSESLSPSLTQSFNLLMTKRSDKASFLGSAFVFPGGHLEVADFSPEWWKVFSQAGFNQSSVNSVVNRINGLRTPIITECQTKLAAQKQFSSSSSSNESVLPADIGLRICAIRETFEEAGVLLALNSSNSVQLNAQSVENWRSKVRDNANDFIQFCLEFKIAPNIWDLFEWWNWLTPNALGHRRFDTMFYVYCTSEKLEADSDQKEVAMIEWYTPNELLDLQRQQKAFLAPPQVYELSRFSNFTDFKKLKEFIFKRESDGVERWIPLVKGYADGSVFFLPGDDMYGLDNKTSIRSMPTLEQARSLVNHLNRIEFKEKVLRAFCNIQLNCGHISPLTFPSSALQSSL